MVALVTVIHVLVSVFLIFVVLVQGGKGAEVGAAFGGGGSQTLFGGRGAATFLSKVTTVCAVVFMFTSLLLTMFSFRGKTSVVSPMQHTIMPGAPANAPATPGTVPGQPQSQQVPPAGQPGAAQHAPAGK